MAFCIAFVHSKNPTAWGPPGQTSLAELFDCTNMFTKIVFVDFADTTCITDVWNRMF